jgi:hypothetical protein
MFELSVGDDAIMKITEEDVRLMVQRCSGFQKTQKARMRIYNIVQCVCHIRNGSSLDNFLNCHSVEENIEIALKLSKRASNGAVVEEIAAFRTLRVALGYHRLAVLNNPDN